MRAQVFDKALSESVFCELYATLCKNLSDELPEFDPEPNSEDGKKVNFRRSLLNKCQVEFEHGAKAMEAVEAREVADARAKVSTPADTCNNQCFRRPRGLICCQRSMKAEHSTFVYLSCRRPARNMNFPVMLTGGRC